MYVLFPLTALLDAAKLYTLHEPAVDSEALWTSPLPIFDTVTDIIVIGTMINKFVSCRLFSLPR